jgi:hypothetical protein
LAPRAEGSARLGKSLSVSFGHWFIMPSLSTLFDHACNATRQDEFKGFLHEDEHVDTSAKPQVGFNEGRVSEIST